MAGLAGPGSRAQDMAAARVKILRPGTVFQDVWPGDFDGDGITDLAGSSAPADGGPASVVVLRGTGGGTFGSPVAAGAGERVVGAADFNGDRQTDLIVAAPRGVAGAVSILPGKGNGTFGTARPVAWADATFVLAKDFSGDGRRDLAIGSEPDALNLYPGNGDFSFGAPASLITGLLPQDGIAADVNGDGRLDIVVANRYGRSVSVFLNRGALIFAAADVPLDRVATDVTAADLNGDGRLDLVVAARNRADATSDFDDGYAYVMLGHGDGTFAIPTAYQVARGAHQVVVGDFNRDGRVDIATANNSFTYVDDCGPAYKDSDSVSILPGLGGGKFGPPSTFALRDLRQTAFDRAFRNSIVTLNTSDVNGDGSTDLIVSDGALLITRAPGPNAAPTVTLGEGAALMDREVVLNPALFDPDSDLLRYEWSSSDGLSIPAIASPCLSGLDDGLHTFTLTVDDGHGHRSSDTVTYAVGAIHPLITGVAGRDIGTVAAPGATTFDGATYTVTGSGADIWDMADEFQFASQKLSGDFRVVVRVDSVENVNPWTKAGLMVRENLAPGARHASIFATPGKGIAFQRRSTADGVTVHTAAPAWSAPVWLKLERRGDVLTGFSKKSAADSWTTVATKTLSSLSGAVHVGLAVTSHQDGVLATARFSSLAIER